MRMEQSGLLRPTIERSALVLMLLVLSACVQTPQEPPPPAVVVTAAELKPLPEPEPLPAPVMPTVVEEPPAVPTLPVAQPMGERVAIVLSSSLPAFAEVASHLVNYFENYDVYDMTDKNRTPQQAFSAIADSNAMFIVAIGLSATSVAKTFATVPVIFSQVFNVSEHDLPADQFKGVSVLPPMDLQVDAWSKLDPNIRDVGAIVGEGHEDLILEAELAMQARGIQFHYAVARSDRETLYHFKRLVRDIDGFILFPDNRILSRNALTEILHDAARHHVQVAVFNDALLKRGATFSTNAISSDIAERIVIALNRFRDGDFDAVEPLIPLSAVRIQTNPEMARKFSLDVSSVAVKEAVADAQ